MPYQHKKRKIRKHRQPDRVAMARRKRERKKVERQRIAEARYLHRLALEHRAGKPTFTQKFGGGLTSLAIGLPTKPRIIGNGKKGIRPARRRIV